MKYNFYRRTPYGSKITAYWEIVGGKYLATVVGGELAKFQRLTYISSDSMNAMPPELQNEIRKAVKKA